LKIAKHTHRKKESHTRIPLWNWNGHSLQLPSSEIGFLRGIVAEREREWREIESEIEGDSERRGEREKGIEREFESEKR
jgi:hypothetical protein